MAEIRYSGQPRRRAPDDKFGCQVDDLYQVGCAVQALEQELRSLGADLVVRERDRGERRPEHVDERHVIETDDGDVRRAAEASLVQRLVAADGQHVVAGHHGGKTAARAVRPDLPPAAGSLLRGDRAGDCDPAGRYREAGPGHRGPETAVPGESGGDVLRPGDAGDGTMAERGEVTDRHLDSALVVDRDRREAVI